MTSGPKLLGPRLLKAGPRLLETAAFGPKLLGPRLLKTASGPRLLGPRLLKTQTRQLHMTGPATFPSQLLTSEKSVKKPAEKKQVDPETSKQNQTRQFNTSRTLKAINDSSTIDFAFLPDASILDYGGAPTQEMRIPILPVYFFPPRADYDNNTGELDIPVFRPIISTASADVTHISSDNAVTNMSEAVQHADFHDVEQKMTGIVEGVAEKLAMTKEQKDEVVAKAQGFMKQAWKGLMEDVFGAKNTKA